MQNWFKLYVDLFQLGLEAQQVVILRTGKMLSGDLTQAEGDRMVNEKMTAIAETTTRAGISALFGHEPVHIAARAVRRYRAKVRANRRRLSL